VKAKRVDANQANIVKYLRAAGIRVQHLHEVGNGCPDIMCSRNGSTQNWLFEIKDPDQPPSKQKLTPKEQSFHENWPGHCEVVSDAWAILRAMEMI
jgi:hypothetical protein